MSLKNVFTIIIPGILIVSCFTNCRQSATRKALSYGDNLKDAIEKFEETRKEFAEEVVVSVDNTAKDLTSTNPDLPDIATDWESQWNDILNKFQTLEEEFSEVGTKSDEYFSKLEEISSGIKDKTYRLNELRKNKELQDKWTVEYVEAAKSIEKIRDVLIEGNDFHRILVASSIRQKIEANINELKSISERAKTLMSDLEKFTIEGKKLIS